MNTGKLREGVPLWGSRIFLTNDIVVSDGPGPLLHQCTVLLVLFVCSTWLVGRLVGCSVYLYSHNKRELGPMI